MRRLTLIPLVLRTVGLGAVVLLLINPSRSRPVAGGTPPLVLLDASLSMAGTNGTWAQALDSARRLGRGGTIWRFGSDVDAFDATAPHDGQSLLAPALAAAAARGGPVVVISDGAIADSADLPPDLARRPRIVVLPRAPFFDAYLASVDGPRRIALGDTVRLRVAYGIAGPRPPAAARRVSIVVSVAGRRITATPVTLPDSGSLASEVVIPPSQLATGFQALDVRLAGAGDAEPRDDARLFVIEVSAQPAALVLAAPPDWESRFFAKTLADVSRVPVKLLVQTEATKWRDGTTLAPLGADAAARAAAGAQLVALIGDPARLAPYRHRAGLVLWPLTAARSGDWYVDPPPASPLAGAFSGLDWDSLPPAQGIVELPADSNAIVLLTARLGRRGVSRPIALVRDSAGVRSATIAGTGLWRWGFRGGAPAEAYRSLVAAIADWLLSDAAAGKERFGPVTTEVPQDMPLEWRWHGGGAPNTQAITLDAAAGSRPATLRFDAQGEAALRLPPGVYRWRAADQGTEQGMVAVEQYSDEWRPERAVLRAQPGEAGGVRRDVGARDVWWLYALALAAFAAEWAWRRRQGLP
ncbi:MAG TPA: hypothetical protein VFI79_01395 [Gemmatimonadales bacterium]|nr:hypothetical protein [Gemmatimonadales bacterium]